MRIKWYEVLILSITLLCVLVFLWTYITTVRASGVRISVERGSAYTLEEEQQSEHEKGVTSDAEAGGD